MISFRFSRRTHSNVIPPRCAWGEKIKRRAQLNKFSTNKQQICGVLTAARLGIAGRTNIGRVTPKALAKRIVSSISPKATAKVEAADGNKFINRWRTTGSWSATLHAISTLALHPKRKHLPIIRHCCSASTCCLFSRKAANRLLSPLPRLPVA
jgi:hypothetical protein